MVYDILEKFKILYKEKGDELILGAYSLKDGLYVKINKDGLCKYFECKIIKKEKVFRNLEGQEDSKSYDWFKEVDYYSSYLNSNKALFDKKIHNINYFSLYFKAENNEYVKGKIREHFNILLSFKKFKDKKEKDILFYFEEYIKLFSRKKDIVKKYRILESNFDEIVQKSKDLEIKNYVKVFFEEDLEKYKKESEIYLSLKIFNDIKYSITIEDDTYGLSNSNMGLNSKKPFLENKTRKLSVPFLLKNKDALMLKKFFDWLKFQQPINKTPLSQEIFLNKDFKEKDLIIDFDYIPLKIEKLEKSIYVTNYLKAYDFKAKKIIEDYTIEKLYQLEVKIDETFYNKQLIHNYFNDIKVSQYISKNLQTLLYETKTSMLNYFKKYYDRGFYQVIKKYGSDVTIEHLRQNRELKAKESLNLKLSLLKHKGENIMDIQNIQKEMITKLETSNYTTLKSEEFFYLCGQIAKYLLSQSEAYQKNGDLLEPFLRANNAKKLKKDIEVTYFKYKHKISLNHIKLNNAISLIMSYDGVEKLSKKMDSFLVGVLSDNIFYMKKEEK